MAKQITERAGVWVGILMTACFAAVAAVVWLFLVGFMMHVIFDLFMIGWNWW